MIRDTSTQDVGLAPTNRGRKRWFVGGGAVVVLLIALITVVQVSGIGSADQFVARDRVRTATVQRGNFIRDIAVQGRVVAAVSPTLYAPDQGTVTLSVVAGDSVQRGQILAVIASAEIQNQLQQEQATLSGAETDLERERIQVKKQMLINQQNVDLAQIARTAAERELRRAEDASEAVTAHERDTARDEVEAGKLRLRHAKELAELEEESLEFELKTADLNVHRQRLIVDDLKRRAAELTVRSPVGGIVGNIMVEQKDSVSKNQPMLTVVDLTKFEVEIGIPETYADELSVGLATTISESGREYRGMLAAVSPEVVGNQVEGRVRFVDGVVPDVRQNQRVSSRILLESKQDVLTLRRGPFLENSAGRVVYVLQGDTATRREVVIGSASVAEVEVLGGLEVGETVIISNTSQFGAAETVLLTN